MFNKIDLLSTEELEKIKEKYEDAFSVFISIKQGENLEAVKELLIKKL